MRHFKSPTSLFLDEEHLSSSTKAPYCDRCVFVFFSTRDPCHFLSNGVFDLIFVLVSVDFGTLEPGMVEQDDQISGVQERFENNVVFK